MNHADLHAIDTKLADCAVRLEDARNDAALAHQIADLDFEFDQLVARRNQLAAQLGLLAA